MTEKSSNPSVLQGMVIFKESELRCGCNGKFGGLCDNVAVLARSQLNIRIVLEALRIKRDSMERYKVVRACQ